MKPTTITLADSRRLILRCQGLDNSWKAVKGREGALQTIERLGYVQIDTISVVQRAHHHTLWSRTSGYRPAMIDVLQKQERRVFEYWDHAASLVPMRNYRYYLHRMRGYAQSGRTRSFLESNAKMVGETLDRIKREGALGSSDFEYPEGRKRAGWWDWKPAKRTLEELFNTGRLMVSHRVNFERKYDLPERVIPAGIDTSEPSIDDRAAFNLRRALSTQGFIDGNEWTGDGREAAGRLLKEMADCGAIIPFAIEGIETEHTFYALANVFKTILGRTEQPDGSIVNVLSPFDNAIASRHRTSAFFQFNYRLEAYFPQHKRKHGYFCLPVLWNDSFIGRLDAKAERHSGNLIIHNLYFERSFKEFEDAVEPLAKRLSEFATFNDCQTIGIERTSPGKYSPALRRAIRAELG